MLRPLAAGLVLALTIPAAAEPPPAPPADAKPSQEPGATKDTDAKPAGPTLLRPGDAPRRELRWAPKPGDTARFEFTTSGKVVSKAGDDPQETLSDAAFTQRVRIRALDPEDGRLRLRFTIEEASDNDKPDAPGAEASRSAYARLKGVEGLITLDPRATAVEVTPEPPADLPPLAQKTLGILTSAIKASATRLPAEAVGAHAAWTVGKADSPAMTVELTALAPRTASIKGAGRTSAANAKTPAPRDGLTFTSLGASGTFSETRTLPLEGLPIGLGASTVETTQRLKVTHTSSGQSMNSVTTSTFTIAARRL